MKQIAGWFFLFTLCPAASPVLLGQAQDLDNKAKRLEGKLMAPCCWTQTVAHHSSEVSTKVRTGIRQRLASGMSEDQVLESFVAEYGERILASPRPKGFNLAAYVLPYISLAAGGVLLVFILRRMRRKPVEGAVEEAPAPVADRYARRLEEELRQE